MYKIFTVAVVAMALSLACGSAFSERTQVRGTGGSPGREKWQLRVENNHWLDAKVYLVPAYGSYGPRIINAAGLAKSTVYVPVRAGSFRLRVEFLSSNVTWTSQIWGDYEPCLDLIIKAHVPATYIIPCFWGNA